MSTKIEWAHETWNPVSGCTPISEGCQNCYAKRMANRLRGRYGYDKDDPFKITLHPSQFYKLDKWKKPRMIFVVSMGDLFHPDVPADWIDQVVMAADAHPQHTFLFLTKRPQRMSHWRFPDNAWIGVTAENKKRYHERWSVLMKIPATVHFVSVEPMLNYININQFLEKPDWVICGAETGPGARPMNPEWVSDLFDQCNIAEIPFFFKKESKGLPVPNYIKVREYPKCN